MSTYAFDGFAKQLDEGLSNDSGFTDPFRVHYFKPFTDEFYDDLLENLPDDKHYSYMKHMDAIRPDGTSTRMVFPLRDERIVELPKAQRAFWHKLWLTLLGPDVDEVFRKHMGLEISERFGRPVSLVPMHPTPMLLRDFSGYRISPHTDKPRKICTIQFYLPQDDSQSPLGTSFYWGKDASRMKVLPYARNTAYAFTVTDKSWHGTDFGPFKGPPRNSLLLTYYTEPLDIY